ncbi:hypothetical protein SDC9_141193 [bioreactor metagenome]|uniref:Uncharacterized protein n=1 Tax=bioreactor metagenome TaxID=1076179 RepID=A0A645DXK2_9ZZZZ
MQVNIIWFSSLSALPAPCSPTEMAFAANVSSAGFAYSKASLFPPVGSIHFPVADGLPRIGQSRYAEPVACSSRSALSLVVFGSTVLVSTTTLPLPRPRTIPFSAKRTCSICTGPGSDMITKSTFWAKSIGLAARTAPIAAARSMACANAS